MNTEFPVETAVMRSVPGEKQTIEKGDLIGLGGYSMVFEGKVLVEGVETRAAVKVIKIRKESSAQSDQVSNVSNSSYKREKDISASQNAANKPHVPRSVPLERINREINCLRQFQESKFILKLLGDVKRPGEFWIITERGEVTIEDCFYSVRLWNNHIEDIEVLVHIFAPILNAVLFLHSKGYVHLDIKPDNMVVNSDGIPKLVDFGLCQKLNGDSLALSKSQVKGSEFFMPPEVVRETVVSRKSDAFSFGFAVTQVYWRLDPDLFFFYDWGGVLTVYEDLEDVEDFKKVQSFLKESVRKPICRQTNKKWKAMCEDISNLVSIDVAARGTLHDLAENEAFKSAMEDWNKYPCEDSELSKQFLRQRGYMAFGFREEPDLPIQVSPALQRYEVYVTAD